MLKEFRDFAMKGNLVDIAVAFVLGAAFGKVITSFTEGLIAPLVGMITGKDLKSNVWVIKDPITDASGTIIDPGVVLKWGSFLTAVIDFLIVAFILFLIIKGINRLRRKQVEAPAAPQEEIALLREIRDALKR